MTRNLLLTLGIVLAVLVAAAEVAWQIACGTRFDDALERMARR